MKPLLLQGQTAYSPFRLEGLSEKVNQVLDCTGTCQIEANFVYLIETEQVLDEQTYVRACSLLGVEEG